MSQAKTGILLANLGTPEAPTPAAVKRYLRQFLSDTRVVDTPRLLWWPLLRGVILPIRAPRVAKLYQSVWMEEGSPLMVYSRRQEKALAARHVDIEQVHLAVLRLLRPLRVKHVAGIVDRVPVAFRHGACDEPDAACARRVAQQTPRLAALRLGVLHKRRIVIWAAPHLRQCDQIAAGRSGIAHIAAHDRIILRFGRRDRHLAQAKLHGIPRFHTVI